MVFGIFPIFLTSYISIFLCRFFLGIGIGMYSPHAISLISICYNGSERSTLLGMQMGIGALGNAVLLSISGLLASWGWRFSFLVYLFLGLIALLVKIFVPEVSNNYSNKNNFKTKINKEIFWLLFLSLLTFTIVWGVQLKIPSLLTENGLFSTKKAGMLLSSMNIAGMLAGFSFGYALLKFNNFVLPLGYLGAAIIVIGLRNSHRWVLIVIFAILFNFIYSLTGPAITVKLNSLANKEQITQVNSYLIMTTIISSFLAPYTWNLLPIIFGMKQNVSNSLVFIISLLIILGVSLILLTMKKKKMKITNEFDHEKRT